MTYECPKFRGQTCPEPGKNCMAADSGDNTKAIGRKLNWSPDQIKQAGELIQKTFADYKGACGRLRTQQTH